MEKVVAEVQVPVVQVEEGADADPGNIESLWVLPWSRATELDYTELMAMCNFAAELLNN